MIKVAVDAMGGDYAPEEIIAGAVDAVKENKEIKVLLVGQEQVVREKLSGFTYDKNQITVVHASEVIATEEPPVNAIRKKKDSSIEILCDEKIEENIDSDFSFNDLMQFGIFLLALLTFVYYVNH